MTLKAHTVPGLSKPLLIPDWIAVSVKIINHERFRSFVKSSAHTRTTFHDTGNPNTNADGEWTWANNGRQGAGVGGYNAICDQDEIIITQPFDEVVWAAGTPEGNRTSYHVEMAFGGGQDFAKCVEVATALHGAICAAKGWEVDTALVKHQYWYGKICPGTIIQRGTWSQVVAQTTAAAANARAAAGGSPGPTPAPTPAAPVVIPALDAISKGEGLAPPYVIDADTTFVWVGDRVRCITETPRLQRASLEAAKIGPNLKPGDEFDVDWLFQFGGTWWYLTPYGSRILAAAVERVRDTKGVAA